MLYSGKPLNKYNVAGLLFFVACLLYWNHPTLANVNTLQKRAGAVDIFSPKPATPNSIYFDFVTRPRTISSSNNLIKKPGAFQIATGEILYIQGIVTDAFGVPVSNAIVEIWQTNATGAYHTLISAYDKRYDPNFSMSGRSITDNLGRYYFITIFPGFYANRAPHINMHVRHQDFQEIRTEVYFSGHPRNALDPYYLSYSEAERELVTCATNYLEDDKPVMGKVCNFDIVLNGVQLYRRF